MIDDECTDQARAQMKDGGPAFPTYAFPAGMNMRQYYKAAALTGVLSGLATEIHTTNDVAKLTETMFRLVFEVADVMVAEDEEHAT